MAVLDKFRDNVLRLARQGLRVAAVKTEERLKRNTGLTDHSLQQLADAGHPYSAEFPQLKFHTPFELIHRQPGRLQDNIRIVEENKENIAIGVNPETVPYLTDVIKGIPTQLYPRDFPKMTLRELQEEKIIEKTIESAISEGVSKS